MDKFTAVAKSYERIRKPDFPLRSDAEFQDLRVWLLDRVVPLLTEFTRLPRFRELACWSISKLASGADSLERGLVDAVDRCLVSSANALVAAFADPEIQPLIDSLGPAESVRRNSEFTFKTEIGSRRSTKKKPVRQASVRHFAGTTSGIRSTLEQVQTIAARDWGDLVNPDDYFSTRQESVDSQEGLSIQRGDMLNSFNPRIHPMSDLVTNGLRHRVDSRQRTIQTLANRLSQLADKANCTDRPTVNAALDTVEFLKSAVVALDEVVFAASDASLRESCVVINHVYVGLHPKPVLDWLGIDDQLVQEHRRRFWSLVTGHRGSETMDRIATAVQDMSQLYSGISPRIVQLETAIASGHLVIDKVNKRAWWNCQRLEQISSRPQLWNLFLALAQGAKRGRQVIESDVYPDGGSARSAMGTLCSRLKVKLPGQLSVSIVSGNEARSYRLNMDPKEIDVVC